MNKQKGLPLSALVFVVIMIAGIGGWIANIIKLASSTFDPITGILVLRGIGVFVAPLGAVMGFI
jgi:hypothetical protein